MIDSGIVPATPPLRQRLHQRAAKLFDLGPADGSELRQQAQAARLVLVNGVPCHPL
ncbi:hypothetical protein [Nonomuraea wenchangensis]|uniref:hypothetical protein n=1 Tax=Nonomuraea wenchangensis TaxID=568860 RepID=UPI0015A62DF9|nr:hypothetical protein [Nonomuraea wenchangensis]